MNNSIEKGLVAYTDWRNALTNAIVSLQRWLDQEGLANSENKGKLSKILNYVDDDNLYISFVSEYSRGKTELINSLLFSQYKKRILPSGVGRTTMCPTEIFYNTDLPLGISLLPIATYSKNTSFNELKDNSSAWVNIPFDTKNAYDIIDAFKHVQETIKVPLEIAKSLGFPSSYLEDNKTVNNDNLIEIPKWRHALVNINHPLLKQNLVILDTPGLNAIGTETNLTINQLSKSHAIVFLLDSSTGVTKSDFALWSKHIKMENNASRMVALNKIDSLWNSIDSEQAVNKEINRIVSLTAKRLNISTDNIFPLSAKSGLIGKAHNRSNMVKKSRIADFEKSLAENLIPSKKKIVLTNIFPIAQSIAKNIDEIFLERSHALQLQQQQISITLNKNKMMCEEIKSHLLDDTELLLSFSEQHDFIDTSFANLIKELRQILDLGVIEKEETQCKAEYKANSSITNKKGVILSYLRLINQKMHLGVLRAIEIEKTCSNIRNSKHLKNSTNVVFRKLELDRHLSMLKNLERTFLDLKLGNDLSTKKQASKLDKEFASCLLEVSRTFKRAFNETNDWQRTLISPFETRVRNQSKYLNERKNNIKQLTSSNAVLKEKLINNHAHRDITIKQKKQLYALVHNINKHLMHSGYTEQDLYKPIKKSNSNIVTMNPNAS